MKQNRQNTYVERELRRRRIEKRYRTIQKIKDCLAGAALIIGGEVFLFALLLCS